MHLRKSGHFITVLTTGVMAKVETAKRLKIIRVKSEQKPEGIFDYLKITRALKKEAAKLPAQDIVISMTDPPLLAIAAYKIARHLGAKHVHWCMDIYPDLLPVMGKNVPKFAYRIAQNKMLKTLKKADALVPISKCMARYMAHQTLPRHKMTIIENWPDAILSENNNEDTSDSIFKEQKFRVLYAGTVGLAHDFGTVIKAAKILQRSNPEVEFVVTKRGRGIEELQDKIKLHGLTNIRLIKPQAYKKLPQFLAEGDLHLITMREEAVGKLLPSKFYNACAVKRPVIFIGPKECDLDYKITRHDCGISVRNGDGKALTNAILTYLNNAKEWFKACDNAGKVLSNHHHLQEWEKLIQDLS